MNSLNCQRLRLLCIVWVRWPRIHFQLLKHRSAKRIARQHTLDSTLQHTLWRTIDKLLKRERLQTTGVTRVVVIHFVRRLRARDSNLFAVDHDDVITHVHVRCVFGLVLAAQTMRDLNSQTPESLVFCVNDKPIVADVACLCTISFHALAR